MLLFKVSPLCCKCICAEIKIDVIRMFRNVQDYVLIKFGTFFFSYNTVKVKLERM